MSDQPDIRCDLRPGDLGRLIALHGTAYEQLDGFGIRFEAYVARTIAEYALDNDANGRIWFAERGQRLIGCAAIVRRDNKRGQLRWVVVEPSERGTGIGKKLVNAALSYCHDIGCDCVYLETTIGLSESQALYEKLGFTVTSETVEELWAGSAPMIVMQLDLT